MISCDKTTTSASFPGTIEPSPSSAKEAYAAWIVTSDSCGTPAGLLSRHALFRKSSDGIIRCCAVCAILHWKVSAERENSPIIKQ